MSCITWVYHVYALWLNWKCPIFLAQICSDPDKISSHSIFYIYCCTILSFCLQHQHFHTYIKLEKTLLQFLFHRLKSRSCTILPNPFIHRWVFDDWLRGLDKASYWKLILSWMEVLSWKNWNQDCCRIVKSAMKKNSNTYNLALEY